MTELREVQLATTAIQHYSNLLQKKAISMHHSAKIREEYAKKTLEYMPILLKLKAREDELLKQMQKDEDF